jgi:hypothetical protein
MLAASHASVPQFYNGYIYASSHVHDVDGLVMIDHADDGPVEIDAHFEVAPGDDNDIQVVNEHAWQSGGMVFGDGGFAWTAFDIAEEKSRIEAQKKNPFLRYPGYEFYHGGQRAEKGIACYFVI